MSSCCYSPQNVLLTLCVLLFVSFYHSYCIFEHFNIDFPQIRGNLSVTLLVNLHLYASGNNLTWH